MTMPNQPNYIEGAVDRLRKRGGSLFISKDLAEMNLVSELQSFARKVMEEIEKTKDAVSIAQGSGKYDSCYDDCIDIISSLSNLNQGGEGNERKE